MLRRRTLLHHMLTGTLTPLVAMFRRRSWGAAVGQLLATAEPAAPFLASLRGVQAQFDEGWSPAVLDGAQAAGVNPTFVRFNFLRRASTEPSPGRYDFREYAPALDRMHALGTRHTMTLFYGSTPWDGDFVGFAAWAVAAALWEEQTHPGTLAIMEIWNEPDGSWPVPAGEYVLMAKAVHDAVRAHRELDHIQLAGAATYAADMHYWRTLIAGGLLDYIDVVSSHCYLAPEYLLVDLPPLKAAIAATPGSSHKPIYISEWGAYGTEPERIGRRLSIMKAMGVRAAAYFPLRDYPLFPTQGLLTSAGGAKEQASVWKEWHERIGDDAVYVGRDNLNSVAYSYVFRKNGATIRHMWATNDTDIVIDGSPVTLTIVPRYVEGKVKVALADKGNTLLADLIANFSLQQGKPFTYLSRLNDDTREAELVPETDRWKHPTDEWCICYANGHQHPGTANKSVRRWLAPSNMRVRVQGSVRRSASGGDGTFVRILHNKWPRFARTPLFYSDSAATFDIEFNILKNDYIDFEVGSGGSDNSFDDVYWDGVLIYAIK